MKITTSLPLLLLPLAALAGPVINADFEASLASGWALKDTPPANPNVTPITTTPVRITTDKRPNSPGLWSLQVSGRDHLQDGLKQNLTAALAANGNGRTYTTRVWVKIDPAGADASVRCLLRRTDTNGAQIPLILAEAVIEQPGAWVEVVGTTKLQWTGSLTNAVLDFEVEQIHKGSANPFPPTWFPVYYADDLVMETDADGDGLFDSEESFDHAQATISFADVPDSDGDGMTDDWERPPHQLNPRDSGDAGGDNDDDGFTNVEEFFAATDPEQVNSYPGKPSDPKANSATRALLRYLALRPSYYQVLVGQMITDKAAEYPAYVSNLAAQNDDTWVAILGLAVESLTLPMHVGVSIDYAIDYTNAGGLAQVKWAMWNPWQYQLYNTDPSDPQLGTAGDLHKVDIAGLLDPAGTPGSSFNTAQENVAARAVLDGWIDTVAVEIQRFNAATGDHPLLFRPLSEMNGNWFWWGHRTRAEYLGLWNHIRNRLINVHGLHNLIWIYESASSEHVHPGVNASATASDYYYPGDDAVDVFSHNLYDEDWVLPFDANKIYARHPKIYGVPQAGPGKTYPSRAGGFSNMIYPDQITARYPRMSFFIVWNSMDSHLDDDNDLSTNINNDDPFPLTIDQKHQQIAIIDNQHASQLLDDTRVITRDELDWQTTSAFQQWKSDHLGSSDSSDLGDPDGDGVPNLLEYALGGDPLDPSNAPQSAVNATANPSRLQMTFSRIADPELLYEVQAANDLTGGWTTIWSSTWMQNSAGPVTITDTVDISAQPRRFLRLNAFAP